MAQLINTTNIPPDRVPFLDERTGLVSREWYRFLYNQFILTGAGGNPVSLSDLQKGPPSVAVEMIPPAPEPDVAPTQDGLLAQIAEIQKQIQALEVAPTTEQILALVDKIVQDQSLAPLPQVSNTIDTNYIDFELDAPKTNQIGRVGWNEIEQTLDIGMEYGVVQQVGQETYARVENLTGVTLPNGTVVGFAGVGANNTLSVAPYLADGTSPSLYILGVMTHDLPNSGEVGYCTTFGHVRGLDTSAFSVGDILYASPTVAGAFTNIKPTAPDNVIPVAAVLAVDATDGEIFVRPTITQMQYYGVFNKTTDQTPALVNTEYLLTFDNTQISNGVIIGVTTSQIIVPQSGLYKFDATLQLTSGSSSAKNIWVWFKKNGSAIANSARIVTSALNNGYIPITLSESVSLAANEYVELAFAADSTNVTVDNVAATAFAPAAPAIILNVTQVQQ
jgi:hypothetical protein